MSGRSDATDLARNPVCMSKRLVDLDISRFASNFSSAVLTKKQRTKENRTLQQIRYEEVNYP